MRKTVLLTTFILLLFQLDISLARMKRGGGMDDICHECIEIFSNDPMYAGKYEKKDGISQCDHSCDYGKLSDHEDRVWCFKVGDYEYKTYSDKCPMDHTPTGGHSMTLPSHGSGTSPSHPQGSRTSPTHLQGSGTSPPHVSGSTMPPHVSGSDTMPPHVSGSTMPPHVSGSDTMPPHVSGSGTMPPHVSGSDTMPPHVSGSDTMPPHVSGSDTMPPHVSASDTMPTHDTGTHGLTHFTGMSTHGPHGPMTTGPPGGDSTTDDHHGRFRNVRAMLQNNKFHA